MDRKELQQLGQLLIPRWNQYLPSYPPSIKQQLGLILPHREIFYGGAAGGGKSDWLLEAAGQYVDCEGYAALLLRRTYPELKMEGGLIPRSHEWWAGTDAVWNQQDKNWTFPSGAVVQFGHMQYEHTKYHYKGSEWHFIGFDELTGFSRTQYLYLRSRNRKQEGDPIPLRIYSASNPGDVGHDWVKERFVDPGHPNRPFIPALVDDNPGLDKISYLESLSELPENERRQLQHGDWNVRVDGTMFKREWFQVIDRAPGQLRICRFWDLASTKPAPGKDPDWTAGVKIGYRDGCYWIIHVVRFQETPGRTELLVAHTAKRDGHDVMQRMEEEPGSSGKNNTHNYSTRILPGYDFAGVRRTGEKYSRMRPLASAAEQGNVYLVRGLWNEAFLDEAEAIPNGSHDDQLDAAAGGQRAVVEAGVMLI